MQWGKPTVKEMRLTELEKPVQRALGNRFPTDETLTVIAIHVPKTIIRLAVDIQKIKERLGELMGWFIGIKDTCFLSEEDEVPGPVTIDRLLPDRLIKSRRQLTLSVFFHILSHLLVLPFAIKRKKSDYEDPEEQVVVTSDRTAGITVWIVTNLKGEKAVERAFQVVSKFGDALIQEKDKYFLIAKEEMRRFFLERIEDP